MAMRTHPYTRIEDQLVAAAEAANLPAYLAGLSNADIERHLSIYRTNLKTLEKEKARRNMARYQHTLEVIEDASY